MYYQANIHVLYVLLFFWVYAFKSPSLFLSHTNKHKDGTLYRLKRHNNLLPELHDYAHIFFRLRHSDTLHTAKPYSQNMNTYVSSNNRNNIRNTPTWKCNRECLRQHNHHRNHHNTKLKHTHSCSINYAKYFVPFYNIFGLATRYKRYMHIN